MIFLSDCSVLEITHAIGKKWAVPILMEINLGKFENFYKFAKNNSITPKVLSKQLEELTGEGLIQKNKERKYVVTEKGKEIVEIINNIKEWNIKWNKLPVSCLDSSCISCGKFPSAPK